MSKETKYIHKHTASIDTREGWEDSYSPEELESRELTAKEAFDEDEGETLFKIEPHTRIILDNSGGITLQLDEWAHHYYDEKHAANDLADWLETYRTDGWDGHEDTAAAVNPTDDEIRIGGYRVFPLDACDTKSKVLIRLIEAHADGGWGNLKYLIQGLADRLD